MELISTNFSDFESLAKKMILLNLPGDLAHYSQNKDIVGKAVKRCLGHNQKLGFNWVNLDKGAGWSCIGFNPSIGSNAAL
jgi:hypothetical protein